MMSDTTRNPFVSGLVEGSIDSKVYQDILKTHARETISFVDYGNVSITNVDSKTIERAQYNECEISPFRKHEFACKSTHPPSFSRKASLNRFSKQKIAWSTVQNLLVHSFSLNENNSRPYPSAGGLYPVEPLVFLFSERMMHDAPMPSGFYHYRPVSQQLQLLKKITMNDFITTLLHGFVDAQSAPCFGIVYVAHIGKSIFKYRYRGYRHALMEAGSMYQQATTVAQQLNLATTAWSTFSEQQILFEIGLDYGTYLPLTMQFFGYGDSI